MQIGGTSSGELSSGMRVNAVPFGVSRSVGSLGVTMAIAALHGGSLRGGYWRRWQTVQAGPTSPAIHAVMAAQTDLFEVLGQFDPKLVKMCLAGDRAEIPW
jgi:hypothetical protein